MIRLEKTVEIWRVEERWNPDSVDFWDFPSKRKAHDWICRHPDEMHKYSEPRQLTIEELHVLAIALIKDYLNGN